MHRLQRTRQAATRRVSVLLVSMVVLAAALLLASSGGPANAAAPAAGTINSTTPTATWTGQFYTAATVAVPDECPPTADPANASCDHYYLTVDEAGGAEITINWSSSDNDFDLFVYDSSGNQVASSASGGTTSEQVFIPNASGTYEVRVVPFLVTGSGYNGSATWSATAPPTPNPTRGTGGLTFGPATVVDAQRTMGEPVNHIDKYGNYWDTGPWGFSTAQMFVHRSTDRGDQFNIVSPAGLRPNAATSGGGDSDITTDDQGFAYFADLEGLVQIGCGVSNDNGNNWRENENCATVPGDDRQWLAVDNGTSPGADDNTVFMAYNDAAVGSVIDSTPGSTGSTDLIGGFAYSDSGAGAVTGNSPCGQLRFDPVNRNLYYPCAAGDHVEITRGHVNVGQRTGITYTNLNAPPSPGGTVGDIFPDVAIDRAGNVYAVWIDESNHNVYYAYSTNQGTTWNSVRQINGNDANSNVFPWAVAGAAGKLVVAWYGNSSHLDSDNMPSWYNDREAATAFPWFGYVSQVTNAASSSPSFAQQRFTEKPMHYGQICNGGLGCTTSMGDRTMADFFAVTLDLDGSMRLIYNDTTSQHHGAHLFEERQLAGPSGYGTTLKGTAPKNPVSDPKGDAQSPHYAPTGTGANLPQFDFTQLKLSQPNASTLRVQMTLNSLASLLPPAGKPNSLWLTRFQALSDGDQGEEAYRIFYVGAESVGGAPPTFFAGSGNSDEAGVKDNGCTTTTAENCKIVQYPAEFTATGSISGNVITIDVPIQGGFGPGRPIDGSVLYNVTALSAGRNPVPSTGPTTAEVYADLDATRSFDFPLSGAAPSASCIDRQEVKGHGEIQGTGLTNAHFSLHARCEDKKHKLKGKVEYKDEGAFPPVKFHSRRITSLAIDSTAHTATITGTGVNSGHMVTYTVQVTTGKAPSGSFSITLSDRTTNSGPLKKGEITIRSK
jgi:hypothetical protein